MTLSQSHYQANRFDLLSRLAGDISHEIKNPLHAMVINLELVRRKVDKGESAQALDRVAIVEEEIRKVHALANGLLEALRPPRDSQTTCAFDAVLTELAPLIDARARCARVELELDAAAAITLPLAAHELRLLLLNLADRGVRAAGTDGRIALHARAASDRLRLDLLSHAAAVDAAEERWLAGSTDDDDTTDLGLRVVRDLIERSGGHISADRADDGRHRLSIVLPGTASA